MPILVILSPDQASAEGLCNIVQNSAAGDLLQEDNPYTSPDDYVTQMSQACAVNRASSESTHHTLGQQDVTRCSQLQNLMQHIFWCCMM